MNALDRRYLNHMLRNDLASFIHQTALTVSPGAAFAPNWHIDAMAWHLQQCLTGGIKRLIITVPPRSLKSISGSVAFPAWALGQDPRRKIICVSYAQDLTAKHARDCRAVMESRWYKETFPKSQLDPAKNSEGEFTTRHRGFRLGASVGGVLTGRGGDIIIIDDPIKPGDAMSETRREAVKQWYDNTLYSRLDSKTDGVIILIMQRVHTDDLVAHVMEKEDWVHLNLPAIAEYPQEIRVSDTEIKRRDVGDVLHPAREPREALDRIKATMGSAVFAAQYQQCPVPPGGLMVKQSWFRSYDSLPGRGRDGIIVQSWDTASKATELNDYSACTTWYVQGEDFYLMDVFRDRLEYPDLKRAIISQARRHNANSVVIEDMGAGIQLIQDLRGEQGVRPIGFRPEGDKQTRLFVQCGKIEAGQILLPPKASWRDDFLAEILSFPNGRHDDQVDSVTQFLAWIDKRRRSQITCRPISF